MRADIVIGRAASDAAIGRWIAPRMEGGSALGTEPPFIIFPPITVVATGRCTDNRVAVQDRTELRIDIGHDVLLSSLPNCAGVVMQVYCPKMRYTTIN